MFGLFGDRFSGLNSGPRYYDIEKVNKYTNREVVVALKKYHNIDLGSVRALNKLLCEMGIIEKIDGRWHLTDYGRANFTGLVGCCYDPNLWNQNIVDAVAYYCRDNDIYV